MYDLLERRAVIGKLFSQAKNPDSINVTNSFIKQTATVNYTHFVKAKNFQILYLHILKFMSYFFFALFFRASLGSIINLR